MDFGNKKKEIFDLLTQLRIGDSGYTDISEEGQELEKFFVDDKVLRAISILTEQPEQGKKEYIEGITNFLRSIQNDEINKNEKGEFHVLVRNKHIQVREALIKFFFIVVPLGFTLSASSVVGVVGVTSAIVATLDTVRKVIQKLSYLDRTICEAVSEIIRQKQTDILVVHEASFEEIYQLLQGNDDLKDLGNLEQKIKERLTILVQSKVLEEKEHTVGKFYYKVKF